MSEPSELVQTRENSFRPYFCKKIAKIRVRTSRNESERVETSQNSNFGNISVMSEPSELVSTRENSSRLENRLESSVKSSECRTLPHTTQANTIIKYRWASLSVNTSCYFGQRILNLQIKDTF
jgi:hypothetical protein